MIEFVNVTKIFNKESINLVYALRGVNLRINKGEFVIIVGNNGAGKTTLLNAIAGVISIDDGQILIEGKDVKDVPEFKRSQYIGRVFQDPKEGTAASLSIEENLALALLKGKKWGLQRCVTEERHNKIKQLLKEIGLGLENRLSDMTLVLSGGERQCIALCMATLNTPKILLLDEHDESLDPKIAETIMKLTEKVVRSNSLTTLMVTHNMERALHFGDRLIMMAAGQIILDVKGEKKTKLDYSRLFALFEKAKEEKHLAFSLDNRNIEL